MQTDTQTAKHTKSISSKTIFEQLFSVGAHFGFTRSRRHPSVTDYIFGNKQGTDIINLEMTVTSLDAIMNVVEDLGRGGKTMLLVGTKEEIKRVVENHAKAQEFPFVVNRWVGGMLTNYSEIKKRIQRLLDLTAQGESGELERKYTKKERVLIGREHAKLSTNFGGIKKMERLPSMLIVIDPRHEAIAVAEASQLNIPVIGLTSSDANIRLITYPILMNDSLQASVSLVLGELLRSYQVGKSEYVAPKRDDARHTTRV